MSATVTAAAEADAATAAIKPSRFGKKKLILILAAVLLLVLVGGGGAVWFLKKRAAAQAAAAEEGEAPQAHAKADDKHAPPVFLPLDVFTVNLADRDADRYAQIGITLEIDEAKTADLIKAYLPAIRNNILMVIAHKNADELIAREGKLLLAREVRREALRPMGIELPSDEAAAAHAAPRPAAGASGAAKAAPKSDHDAPQPPIRAVHFSSFIIQ